MRRVVLRLHLHISHQNTHQRKNWNCLIFFVILGTFERFEEQRLEFFRKIMYSLVNVENY